MQLQVCLLVLKQKCKVKESKNTQFNRIKYRFFKLILVLIEIFKKSLNCVIQPVITFKHNSNVGLNNNNNNKV